MCGRSKKRSPWDNVHIGVHSQLNSDEVDLPKDGQTFWTVRENKESKSNEEYSVKFKIQL